jgi:predicted phosphoadenosine phosphosulfate sulfurtransferase
LHNFEIRIIKAFEDRIIKTEPGYSFAHGKKDKITVTFLNITLADLKNSGLIETYRHEHNSTKHYFSEKGKANSWIPDQKLSDYFKETPDITGVPTFKRKCLILY